MPSPNTCFLLPGRTGDVLHGKQVESGEERLPPGPPSGDFLLLTHPGVQMPAENLAAQPPCWQGESPSPELGWGAGGEQRLREVSLREAETGLSGPGAQSSGFAAGFRGPALAAFRA